MLSYENQNLEAYQALGDIYFNKKEWENAQQTLEHLVKLTPNDPAVHQELGEVYLALDEDQKAFDYFHQAVELEGNNPKYLTSLLELAIKLKKKVLAVTTLRQLKEANPENQALDDFEKQIEEL